LSDAVIYGLEYHPDILRLKHEVKANEYNLMAARASFGPTMSIGAQIGDSTSYDLNGSVSLTINLPLYKGGQLNSLLRKAHSAVHASKASLRQQGLVTHKNIAQSWSQLSVSKSQLSSNERQILAAEIAFFGVREEASLGARTTLEVLDAEQVLFDAQTNRVILETQSQLAGYQLLASAGKLTANELNIDLENYKVIDYSDSAHTAPSIFSQKGKKLSKILKRYSN
jgi:outer membrane protein